MKIQKRDLETGDTKPQGSATLKDTAFDIISLNDNGMPELERYGLKVVSWFKDNPAKNLPALFGTTLLFDSKTGAPCSLLDAEYIRACAPVPQEPLVQNI